MHTKISLSALLFERITKMILVKLESYIRQRFWNML